ncbi:hypothetical protein [Kozakia baliensis]|uniref:Uncharacterized protein n=1 Tax=Kozakia baliensis TaxID=153496 RepID=A0A1D8UUE3_9PROT|nr:hypothetical protein [Kozakia baliensis]AOX17263.1 hypothetical protein A0U89_09100 [Kozakia baliensis]GBR29850.1 hypothetical protein AA0488_1821 [Kozakia baliensis NRIC 0488]GEL63313.1 hypothetical protein KBA01_05990 [Kozakia baliensis]
MFRKISAAALALGLLASPMAHAKSCRDTKGKFTKCETPKPAKCRDAKGRFVKCDAVKQGSQKDAAQPSPSGANPT